MNKTIVIAAVLATASAAQARRMPDPRPVQTVCVRTYALGDSSQVASCNEAYNNVKLQKPLLENGCAAGQVAIKHHGDVQVESCLPPGLAQL